MGDQKYWDTAAIAGELKYACAERDQLRKVNGELLAALQDVQWAGHNPFSCVECGGPHPAGHTKDCRLRAAIARAEGKPGVALNEDTG